VYARNLALLLIRHAGLWREDATRIDLLTIEVLCNTLQVRPGQLFDYDPEPDRLKRKRKARGRKKTSS